MVARIDELWFNAGMNKQHAIELLGGSVAAAARSIGVTFQAVDKWPDVLPPRIADRVQAVLWRRSQGEQSADAAGQPTPSESEPAKAA